ncbi:SDR family NAD(P)-dependent oxidoreductase [Actinoplanes sp. NPDC051861]|uniref:SDR family NAD(P)-dependent oxidoreductase n=1 Tax=Actinoplanes sp. NPDC051861 TaxID=3155170 RepID=UPI003433B43E
MKRDLRNRYGGYALITGASSGIGAEFAAQMAAAGLDLVLVARRKERLDDLADRLTEQHGVATEVAAVDLAAEDAIAELTRRTEHLDISVLVASAGVVTSGPFLSQSLAAESSLLHLDLTVPMQLTHHYGRRLVARRRGALILLSSAAGFAAVPYSANYAAAKAYLASLGQALHHELRGTGVDVLTVAPGPTRTEGIENAEGIDFTRVPLPLMTPDQVVRASLRRLGRGPLVIPGSANRISDLIGRHLLTRRTQTALFGTLVGRALDDHQKGII